jgi:hypothetical protein
MNAAHTRGPWFVDHDEAVTVRDVPENGRICGLSWLRAPFGLNGRKTNDEVAANARLIAAAPDMLAALKETLPQAEGCWANHYGDNPEGGAVPHHIQMIRDAIAKAEGSAG